MNAPNFKSFEAKILSFNLTYGLPVAPYPTTSYEIAWTAKKNPGIGTGKEALVLRLQNFRTIMENEVKEINDIIDSVIAGADDVTILTELADLLGDVTAYCASEAARYGIPLKEVLSIIMDSNFSKLGADGLPIYDENNKVMKGPNYWKPEPKIKELIVSYIYEAKTNNSGNEWTAR